MPATMTFNSLVQDMLNYVERNDTKTVNQIPRCIMLAENSVAMDLKVLGTQTVVAGSLTAGNFTLPKPGYWRETISFKYLDPVTGRRKQIFNRSLEYCQIVYPDPAYANVPKFYADYDPNNFMIAPTPALGYEFELVYYARAQPLDETHQTNWFTINAPQELFYRAMMELNTFLRNWAQVQVWEGMYNNVTGKLGVEDRQRAVDRNGVVVK